MIYNWFKIINRPEFEATGLPSRELELFLTGIGLATIRVTVGNEFSLVYDDVMLPVPAPLEPAFTFEGYAAYQNDVGDVYLGVEVE